MVHHNNMLPNIHLGKDWQEKVKTWFNQPGRKHRRRRNRLRKAKLTAPNPTHTLKPIVRGQTNKYDTKIRLGRGFTKEELKKAGLLSLPFARSIGIAIDLRRKDCSVEAQNLNVQRLKDYLGKIILYPKVQIKDNKPVNKPEKKPMVKEATDEQLNSPQAKEQNTTKTVIPLPKPEPGYSFAPLTDDMKKKNVYETQRKEIKTAKGFYKRLEAAKKKGKK